MNDKYLPIDIYRHSDYDCTLNGISSLDNPHRLFVKSAEGHLTEDEIKSQGVPYALLEARTETLMGNEVTRLFQIGKKGWAMFGGNFGWSNDSRFGGNPIKIMDRFEK
mgnify:CR=1 FL=1